MTYAEAKALFEEDLKGGKCSDDCPECSRMECAIDAFEELEFARQYIHDQGLEWDLLSKWNERKKSDDKL